MSSRRLLPLALAAALAAPPAALAMLADVPLEILAGQSELIVVAQAIEAGPPAKQELNVPDSPRPVNAWFTTCTLEVTRVIKDSDAARAGAPAKRKIQILTRSPRPQQPGRPRIWASDMYFASLKVGQSYVLILRKMPGRVEYYLPTYPKNYRPARPDEIARIARAANVEKWPWGEAVEGLRIALVPRHKVVQLRQVRRAVRGKDGRFRTQFQGQSAFIPCVVAIRNVSDGPITVSLYPGDRFLSLTATSSGGRVVAQDLYKWLAAKRLAPFGPQHTAAIASGQLLFIHAGGKGSYGTGLNLDLAAGIWKLQAAYSARRKVAGEQTLWSGTVKSAPAAVEVRGKPKRL